MLSTSFDILMNNIITSFFISIFGDYWYVFIGYMVLNLVDWITGMLKAIKHKEVSSQKGISGLMKKLGYWIVIGISFSFSSLFVVLGNKILNMNLSIFYFLGWFTLASLIIDEVISILENLTALNIKIPSILKKSINFTDKLLDSASSEILNNDKTDKLLDQASSEIINNDKTNKLLDQASSEIINNDKKDETV